MKQTDFDIRVFDIVAGNTSEGGMTHEQVREFIKAEYLDKGWSVLSVENAQISANHAFFAVYLVKYEDVQLSGLGRDLNVKTPSLVEKSESPSEPVVKRGPGRPPKE